MKLNLLKHSCAALALIAPMAAAPAAVITINRTIDLNTLDLSDIWFATPEFGPVFSLAVGDTLNLNIDFAGKQTLKAYNPLNIIAMVMATDTECISYTGTGHVVFANAKGPLKAGTHTDTMGCSHFGNQFETATVTTGPGTVEFSGLSFSMHVDAYDIGTTRAYKNSWFQMAAEGYSIGQFNDVPEPASVGLMGLGIAGLMLARRRA
ncbi:MAG TPA: PEP-CTERM sorting domain-containing protein [Telluria sp.]|jgi:hypothetical protein